jgi:metallo-beta-lactamase family protein
MDLRFLGAAREVTGSSYLIRSGQYRILVDCGLIQGSQEDEERNREPFPFDPASIDAVILTHAHLDHSGRFPMLVKEGFKGRIFSHSASRDLCRIMLKDAAYLNEKEAEWENRKRQRKHQPLVEPIYSMEEAIVALRRFRPLEYNQEYNILPGVKLCLRDAGHILGSSIVELWLKDQGVERKLVFSGDLGHVGAPILRDPELAHKADLVIMESTYGDRRHRSREDTWAEMADIFSKGRASRGNIMIPAFAVGRTQELLYTLGWNFDAWGIGQWQIFLDSPMAIEATRVYARHTPLYDEEASAVQEAIGNPFLLPNLNLSHTANQSMAINRISDGAIIIAGSGRWRHHYRRQRHV